MVKFGYTIYYVNDVMGTIEFFENSFGFKRKFVFEDNSYAELETGHTVLAFSLDSNLPIKFDNINFCSKGLIGCEITLVCDNVEDSFNKCLKFGGVELSKPEKKPWGQIVSYIKSPCGVLIELCNEVEN